MGALILIRHGQSQWNLENRFTGWVDVPLTDAGREEARRGAALIKHLRFDRAFTSALVRATTVTRFEPGHSGMSVANSIARSFAPPRLER